MVYSLSTALPFPFASLKHEIIQSCSFNLLNLLFFTLCRFHCINHQTLVRINLKPLSTGVSIISVVHLFFLLISLTLYQSHTLKTSITITIAHIKDSRSEQTSNPERAHPALFALQKNYTSNHVSSPKTNPQCSVKHVHFGHQTKTLNIYKLS